MKCKICVSEKIKKNGVQHGKQAYLCKNCNHQFISEFGRHTEWEEKMVVSLYSVGLSFRTIADLFMVNCSTIMRWVRRFSLANYSKPMPTGKIEVELDEMCCFIHEKKEKHGYGKHTTEQINNLLTGKLATEAQKLYKGCMTG